MSGCMPRKSKSCCIPGCSSGNDTGTTLHSFPQDKDQASRWEQFVGPGFRKTPWSYVCKLHFHSSCYVHEISPLGLRRPTTRLKATALPSNTCIRDSQEKEERQKLQLNRQVGYSLNVSFKPLYTLSIPEPTSKCHYLQVRRPCSTCLFNIDHVPNIIPASAVLYDSTASKTTSHPVFLVLSVLHINLTAEKGFMKFGVHALDSTKARCKLLFSG